MYGSPSAGALSGRRRTPVRAEPLYVPVPFKPETREDDPQETLIEESRPPWLRIARRLGANVQWS